MAATSTRNTRFTADVDTAAERIRETNDRLAQAGRKLTTAYLDGVEKYTEDVARAERKLGEQSRVDAVSNLLSAHANLTEDVVKAGVAATRQLITV